MDKKAIFYPHIEGLRGLAVLLVVFYHLNNNFFFGYLGVDIFFVISGYVITKSLIINFEQNSLNVLSSFYSKRILRIYPALFLTTLSTFLIYTITGNISNYEIVFKSLLYSIFGLSNIYFLRRSSSYFDEDIDNPLTHTWSLGVEEQFYIIFPIILLLYFKIKKNLIKDTSLIVILIFFFSISIFYFFFENNELIKFWSPLTRFWEILIGSIFCLLEKKNRQNYFLLYLIILIVFLNLIKFQLDNFYLTLSILFSILIISQKKNSLINFYFSNKPMRFIGKISYSMYLIHYPLLYFFNIYYEIDKLFFIIIYLLVLIFFSNISYQYIERKFLNLKINIFQYFFKKKIIIIIFIILIIPSFNFVNYINKSLLIQKNSLEKINLINQKFHKYEINSSSYKKYNYLKQSITSCVFENYNKKIINSNCFLKNNNTKLIFFVGDSHAASLIMLTDKSYNNYDIILAANAGGLFSHNLFKIDGKIINEKSLSISKKYNEFFKRSWEHFKFLSLEYDQSYFIISSDYLTHINENIILDENFLQIKNKNKLLKKYANELINLSERLKNNEKIIFIKNIPQPIYSSFECLKRIEIYKNPKTVCDYNRDYYGEDVVYNILNDKKIYNFYLYDFANFFCDKKKCDFFNKKNKFNIIIDDKSHITQQSVYLFKNEFFNFLNEISK